MSFLDDNPSKRRVCAVMCTYGRFEIVKQSLTMFLAQDYPNKQLVIFNTAPTPLVLDEFLMSHPDIKVVNQTHKSDGTPYKSLGCVRNASLEHAEGDIYICWDDDDLFMPWHITQAMSHWSKAPVVAWKPDVSYWSQDGGKSFLGLMGNAMEASFVVGMKHMKQYGFSTERSGAEHVDGGWLDKTDALVENISPFESYGYIWGDKRAGHKTSGHIGDVGNFENHKNASVDFGDEPLSICSVHMFDKFFKSAIAMWDKPSLYEGINTQVTASQVEDLKGLMRGVYNRHSATVPDFLQDNSYDFTPFEEPSKPSVYDRPEGWTPPHGACEQFVWHDSRQRRNGFFVEFGGVDGLSQSNSYRLQHDLGWDGLLIEGHSESFKHLQKNRPEVTTVKAVISSEEGKEFEWIQFEEFECTAGNFDHSRIFNPELDERVSGKGVSYKQVKTRTLKSILDEHNAPRRIDFLSIDIETSDLENIVQTLPFEDYVFDYIGLEYPNVLPASKSFDYLIKSGYILVDTNTAGPDYIFIRKELYR